MNVTIIEYLSIYEKTCVLYVTFFKKVYISNCVVLFANSTYEKKSRIVAIFLITEWISQFAESQTTTYIGKCNFRIKNLLKLCPQEFDDYFFDLYSKYHRH